MPSERLSHGEWLALKYDDHRPEYYIRVCDRCDQFHNWRVLPLGGAVCLDCGHVHGPRPSLPGGPR